MTIKLLIIGDHTEFHTGGVATHVATLSSEIARRGEYEIIVVVLLRNSEKSKTPHTCVIKSKNLKICGSKGFFRHIFNIVKHGKKADIIHTHNLMSTIFGRLIFPKKPLVRTVHGYYSLERIARRALKPNSVKFRIIRKIEEYGVRFPDRIISVDGRIKKWLLDLDRSEDKFKVILNTPPKDQLKFIKFNREYAKKPKNKFVIGYAKALTPKNGPTYLVRGFKKLVEEYGIKASLVIIGDGPLREEIIKLSKGLEHMVILKGNLPHDKTLRFISDNIDVLVVPSINIAGVEEASSLVAQEAMYLGVPVIASNIGGLKDILRDMKTGILVRDRDPDGLARAIVLLWETPKLRRKLAHLGKKSVSQRDMEGRVSEVYLQAMKNKLYQK